VVQADIMAVHVKRYEDVSFGNAVVETRVDSIDNACIFSGGVTFWIHPP